MTLMENIEKEKTEATETRKAKIQKDKNLVLPKEQVENAN